MTSFVSVWQKVSLFFFTVSTIDLQFLYKVIRPFLQENKLLVDGALPD